jgi:Fe2+ transport system protein FeoA
MAQLLSEIKKNKSYVIKNIQGAEATRLMEMGVIPGLPVELMSTAPLGFPLEIKVRGCLLSLRENEAKCVEVEG